MRTFIFSISLFLLSTLSLNAQPVKHVILISIDGFHPDMYEDSTWPTPNLRELMKKGTYADHMLSVFPAYTYPSHTAMLTGALPARSGIFFNQPKGSKGEWNWFTSAIKTPTLWQVFKKAGLTTAAVEWPASVSPEITWDLPEIWDVNHPDDRITATRQYASPGLVEEIEQHATGKLDSTNLNDNYFSLDENAGRAAAYIFMAHKPSFLAVHFATVDGNEHDQGRDGDSVRLAVACNDRAIGDILEAVQKSGLTDSTTILIVGDHGFSTIHTVFRVNMLIKHVPAIFIASGGSAFLYRYRGTTQQDVPGIVQAVRAALDSLPGDKRNLFRIIDRAELDKMGADSSALLALAAVPGTVFSGATQTRPTENHGPGTLIQQGPLEGVFVSTHGGHHGYDPREPLMYTGFIAEGAAINKGGHIGELCVTDIAPLVARLLGVPFTCPDGKLVSGIIQNSPGQ
ncbi:MAG: ectonucleotide pyrophosphatase/phosphodiesterase [Puia sp.]|nr:ectonucleotide pyrophosphatase/phosphodiesterase [Puia sp.]